MAIKVTTKTTTRPIWKNNQLFLFGSAFGFFFGNILIIFNANSWLLDRLINDFFEVSNTLKDKYAYLCSSVLPTNNAFGFSQQSSKPKNQYKDFDDEKRWKTKLKKQANRHKINIPTIKPFYKNLIKYYTNY